MALKRKLDLDSEDVPHSNAKQLKLIPFPNSDSDPDVLMCDAYPEPHHARLPSNPAPLDPTAKERCGAFANNAALFPWLKANDQPLERVPLLNIVHRQLLAMLTYILADFVILINYMQGQSTILQYEAPWPVHCLDWSKSAAAGQRPRSAFRLGIASLVEGYNNRIAVIGLQDDRVLVEDDYTEYSDFVALCETSHGYPVTNLQWQPAASSHGWSSSTELLAATGDALRVFEYHGDAGTPGSAYVGRQSASSGHTLTTKTALSGQSKVQTQSLGAPLTNFSWNEKAPNLIVTSSIDTTCTVWNIETSTAITQLIAHDREVYDVAWLPGSTDIFVSVGADGSLRAFDLRSLEHSTILYETPTPKHVPPPSTSPSASARPPTSPLLRIGFNPSDSNYMSTFHMDGNDIQILDMRSPGQPVMELRAHHAPINAFAWGPSEQPLLATAGDDCQVLLWDLSSFNTPAPQGASPRSASSRLNSPRPDTKKRVVTEPLMAYTAPSQVTNVAWSPQIQGLPMHTGHSTVSGEWLAIVSGKAVKALKL
ncbi:hypothetical protein H0H93_015989 [Arthromyces matolae]|nr:hypothetical protein H0H93_015989 [Arthromyces matolae]